MKALTFEQCYEAAKIIAKKIGCCSASYHAVYGIPKGGMIPAAMVAYHLRLPLTGKPDKGVLIVDDTINTGKNYNNIADLYGRHDLAVLQIEEKNKDKAKYYGLLINDFTEFPWEKKEWGFLNQ